MTRSSLVLRAAALLSLAFVRTCVAQLTNAVEIIASTNLLASTYKAVTEGQLQYILEGVGPYTVFAPTTEAWDNLGPGVFTSLLMPTNSRFLKQVIQYHLCYGGDTSSMFVEGQEIKTLEGNSLKVSSLSPFQVNNVAKALSPDIPASNGILHIIDTVMIPPDFEYPEPLKDCVGLSKQADYLTIFAQAIKAAEMEEAMSVEGPITVFAPTNAAFESMGEGVATSLLLAANKQRLKQVLQYHTILTQRDTSSLSVGDQMNTLEGGMLQVSQVTPSIKLNQNVEVTSTNVPATNGIMHILGNVLLPFGFVYPDKRILDILEASPELSTLYTAVLTNPDLTDYLRGVTDYTLFAPTNEAFENLGIGVASSLLLPSNQVKLTSILRYHLLAGSLKRSGMNAYSQVATLERQTVEIGTLYPLTINGARVSTPDVPAINGAIHIIDTVLLPTGFSFPDKDVMQLARSAPELAKFTSTVVYAGLEETLKGTGPFTIFAPTDEAWDAMDPYYYGLCMDDQDLLKALLEYHVVMGSEDSSQLTYGREIATLNGDFIKVTPWTELGWQGIAFEGSSPPITLNTEAKVSTNNVLVTNGLVHMINQVLIPPTIKWPKTTEAPFITATSSSVHTALPARIALAFTMVCMLRGSGH
eukprot:CAMPEP_0197658144 /NCGR_PEP_ID=MMETSP1338-20131121/45058_1 /TAXON_ID=43686 ORGANISM="Pelagodinium beii, Strain RCC1491" /NCGR_SAMPLE_ID=MMETSP1338 /ASSEMBLY_ACC=CAM_ASM_000754 /LENGTH=642 /DNA_ID=CAMNT_0043234673 /DNA_START=31 /DNA_END=1959 /DNA_ORIENTATION=+